MTRNVARTFFAVLLLALTSRVAEPTSAAEPLVLISAFAGGDDGGIHAFQLEPDTGRLKQVHRTGEVENPFFMAISPGGKYLYSIYAKSFGGPEPEQVAAFAIEAGGKLRPLNRQSTHGSASCYLQVDDTGRSLLVANYSTGNVASLPVAEDGSLGEAASVIQHAGSSVDPTRQTGPFAHSIIVSPDNRFAYAADLGLDQILGYRLDPANAKLSPNVQPFVRTPPGAGPRHLTFHPNGKHLYAINELQNSVTLFDYLAESGILIERQTISTLPEDFDGQSYCADLKITPDGRFLYGTNRGHDSIAAYQIGDDGRLTLIDIEPSLGAGPQNLLVASEGALLICANMAGSNVAVFHINPTTGRLKSTGQPVAMPSPSCIRLLP